MSSREPPANPRAELVQVRGGVRPLRSPEVGSNFSSLLVPIVDRLRQLNTSFGLRPYRVFLVYLNWTGGRRGDGVPQMLSRTEVLPTPRVDLGGTIQALMSSGMTESGGIKVTEISAKFAEDDLMGHTTDWADNTVPTTGRQTIEFFWEIVEDRQASPPKPRRYYPEGPPIFEQRSLGWSINLLRQDQDNRRNGGTYPRGAL